MPRGPNTWWLVPWGILATGRETLILTLINTARAHLSPPPNQPSQHDGGVGMTPVHLY
jgi:hypothetical protein